MVPRAHDQPKQQFVLREKFYVVCTLTQLQVWGGREATYWSIKTAKNVANRAEI